MTSEMTSEITQLIQDGELDSAETRLRATAKGNQDSAAWWLLSGEVAVKQGRIEDAAEHLERACDLEPSDFKAAFRLAQVADLHGDDETALDYYEMCIDEPPIPVNALMNLAVTYEDQERYDEAEACLKHVLEHNPNHTRAAMFLKDVVSSQSMYYDEDLERTREKHDAVLDIPISDFELSVRSRNCLKKMDIHTLGDLLRTTETELLSYKNFGETSLNEIKVMLTQKGLHLGQLLDEEPRHSDAAPGAPTGDPALMNKLVGELELSVRSRKCLQRLGIITVGDLASKTEAELLNSKNFGQTSLREIKQRLAENGLSVRKLDNNL